MNFAVYCVLFRFETILSLSRRSKLYRYFVDSEDGPSWKERGVGDVRILQHKKDKTYRLVMRRDKTLKLCANHQCKLGR